MKCLINILSRTERDACSSALFGPGIWTRLSMVLVTSSFAASAYRDIIVPSYIPHLYVLSCHS